jgi:hypothetical protein
MAENQGGERGILSYLGILIGGGCVLIALVGALNTALDLDLALQFYGSSTSIPDSYDEVTGLAAAGALIIGLSLFGSFVLRRFSAAKGKPLVRAGILLGAVILLVLVGRGIQIVALKSTYGSMLAYYATDGDLDDVKSELAKKPDREALDSAVSRAGQYNNAGALALLLAAGADMRDSTRPEDLRRCALVGRSYEFIKVAIEHGVKPDACPRGEHAVLEAVKHGKDDAAVAKTVALLIGAGWSASAKPEYEKQSAKQIATQKKWSETLKALGGAAQ